MRPFILFLCFLSLSLCLAYKEVEVPIVIPSGSSYMVSDSFNGVDARYDLSSSSSTTYQCAEYTTRYLKNKFGCSLNYVGMQPVPNMSPANCLWVVKQPLPGDYLYRYTSLSTHSALVKAVEGSTITLIEQNFKYYSSAAAATVTTINRHVTLKSDGLVYGSSANDVYTIYTSQKQCESSNICCDSTFRLTCDPETKSRELKESNVNTAGVITGSILISVIVVGCAIIGGIHYYKKKHLRS
eukprot:TRINITY_DN9311_c0_g1_i1.p1 TRINITY_DN9311_c0_g1~~TRINITY_DN9311_c0_g1_i1.p1  ORF type:complete len:249 (-),score=18.06 TRINITY_DN9311_c0_g1_i1:60-782(-)